MYEIIIEPKLKKIIYILSFFVIFGMFRPRYHKSIISEWFDGFQTFSVGADYPTNWSINGLSISIGTTVSTAHSHLIAAFDYFMRKKMNRKKKKIDFFYCE